MSESQQPEPPSAVTFASAVTLEDLEVYQALRSLWDSLWLGRAADLREMPKTVLDAYAHAGAVLERHGLHPRPRQRVPEMGRGDEQVGDAARRG